ncbi:MAG: sensor histidine kinase [Bacteroidota bacterium]
MDDLAQILIIGVLGMAALAIAIVLFFVIYQRRLLAQQDQLQETERNYQKELLNNSIQVQEVERERIAKDLHDSVGSTLSATKLYLYRLNNEQTAPEFQQLKSETEKLLDNSIQNIRQTTRDLLPVNLERFGLIAAIEDTLQPIQTLNQVQIEFNYNQSVRFLAAKEIALFRIIQELLNNTLKHANANQIKIDLQFYDQQLKLTYEDDGVGFDLTQEQKTKGIGLKSIESRIKYLNASYDYKTAQQQGLFVQIVCPSIDVE